MKNQEDLPIIQFYNI